MICFNDWLRRLPAKFSEEAHASPLQYLSSSASRSTVRRYVLARSG
jgi:hypothetical protein